MYTHVAQSLVCVCMTLKCHLSLGFSFYLKILGIFLRYLALTLLNMGLHFLLRLFPKRLLAFAVLLTREMCITSLVSMERFHLFIMVLFLAIEW